MGIREKLLDFKRRLSDRRMYSIVIVIIGAISIWGIYQYKHAANLRQELDNQYNRAFFDMVGYVRNIDVLLLKSLISSTPEKTSLMLQEAWRQANLAQTNLGQLPVSQQVLANTSKFLTQLGDLAYSLNNQNLSGKPLDSKQYKLIERLHGFAVTLGNGLNDLQYQLSAGRLKWGDLSNKGTPLFRKTSANLSLEKFKDIDKTFQEYPRLIYDGPFSDHMVTAEPKGLTGKMLNEVQAEQCVRRFFGAEKIQTVKDIGKNNVGPVKTFSYRIAFKNSPGSHVANISVTQKGGQIIWMLYDRPVKASKIKVDRAIALGKEFLESRGYKGMTDTYFLKEDNTATVNYAYKQDNVTVYPDLIKLKIALDNGEIIGFESKGYIYAHTARVIPPAKITEQQARALISPKIKVADVGLVIIPTEYKTEIFTYELKGTLNKRDFIVYINAENGKEEKILMIIKTPNGILTM